jgi:hypothetical protein
MLLKRNPRYTLCLCAWLAMWLILPYDAPAQNQLPPQAATTGLATNPELKVSQLSSEWDDWIYSADGNTTAYSATLSGVTQVLDVTTKRTTVSLPDRGMLAMANDGSSVAIGTQKGALSIWDAKGFRSLAPKHKTQISAIAMTPNGRWAVTGDFAGTVKSWDVSANAVMWSIDYHDKIQSLALSEDGSYVLVCWGSGAAFGATHSGSEILDSRSGKSLKKLDSNKGHGIRAGALSADGRFAATVREMTRGITFWDVRQGKARSVLENDTLSYISLSNDGTKLAALTDFQVLLLIDIPTGKQLAKVDTKSSKFPGFVKKLQFIRQGEYLTVAVYGFGSVILSAKDGEVVDVISQSHALPIPMKTVNGLSLSSLVLAESSHLTALWDLERGDLKFKNGSGEYRQNIARLQKTDAEPRACDLDSATISGDGSAIAGVLCKTIVVIPTNYGLAKEFDGLKGRKWIDVGMLRLSPSGRYLMAFIIFADNRELVVWDLKTDDFKEFPLDDTKFVTLAEFDGEQRVWLVMGRDPMFFKFDGPDFLKIDLNDQKIERREHLAEARCDWATCGYNGITVSRSGRSIAYRGPEEHRLRDFVENLDVPLTETSRGGYGFTPAFSCDEKLLAYGNSWGGLNLYDVDARAVIWNKSYEATFGFSNTTLNVSFSCKDKSLFVLAEGRLFRLASNSNTPAAEYKPALGEIKSFSEFTPKDLLLAATSTGIDIFDKHTTKLLATLIMMKDGPWVVISPDGRFDTQDPESLGSLSWTMSDDRFHPLPIEIFMRDYYEPKLLPRLLDGRDLQKVRPLAQLNRAQPEVKLLSVKQGSRPDLAEVTVEVSAAEKTFQRNVATVSMRTGVHDLRLFRDGQLIKQWPGPRPGSVIKTGTNLTASELKDWQDATEITLDPTTGRTTLTYMARMPHGKTGETVQFSAYAFNLDRVKSETATRSYTVPHGLAPIRPRAYIVSIGVNAYEDPGWDLRFAASDASLIQEALRTRLARQYEVVPIKLVSDYKLINGVRTVTEDRATREALKAVLEALSGRETNRDALAGVVHADKLRKADPDDLVVLSISSHGYTDANGLFYLIPSNSGKTAGQNIRRDLLKKWVSSDELAEWLRDVDAGELVMIVDTCHSAATVDSPGFKPGPMGSHGLGQLAYDKGMKILAASQADDVALELGRLKQGLLTYALMQEGLNKGKANSNRDDRILLDEWLAYGAERVPTLYDEIRAGRFEEIMKKDLSLTAVITGTSLKKNAFQQPQLFDFKRNRQDIVIALTKL